MIPDSYSVTLASASPRRRDLLKHITSDFKVTVSNAPEIVPDNATPFEAVALLSSIKAESVAEKETENTIVIGADTVVASDGMILGKPGSQEEAFNMLNSLQGKTHQVFTGVTIVIKTPVDQLKYTFTECTSVAVAPMSEAEIQEYIDSGDPMDKAGSYGIQGIFSKHVEGIKGDYNNVVGLPVARLNKEINNLLDRLV